MKYSNKEIAWKIMHHCAWSHTHTYTHTHIEGGYCWWSVGKYTPSQCRRLHRDKPLSSLILCFALSCPTLQTSSQSVATTWAGFARPSSFMDFCLIYHSFPQILYPFLSTSSLSLFYSSLSPLSFLLKCVFLPPHSAGWSSLTDVVLWLVLILLFWATLYLRMWMLTMNVHDAACVHV